MCSEHYRMVEGKCVHNCPDGALVCSKEGDDKCVSQRHVCDGHRDCLGGEDEDGEGCGELFSIV